jgi:hypothetical protein
MQIEIKYEDQYEYDDIYAICPICSNKVDIQFRDYVEKHPMVWCWHCEISSKFVIDCSITDIDNLSENKTYDLLLVKRIANTPNIYKFIDNYNKNNNTLFEDLNEIQKHMDICDDVFNKIILDEVGIELNCYNICDILKKEPEYDLSHDGCFILIEVLEKNSSLTRMFFLGD